MVRPLSEVHCIAKVMYDLIKVIFKQFSLKFRGPDFYELKTDPDVINNLCTCMFMYMYAHVNELTKRNVYMYVNEGG